MWFPKEEIKVVKNMKMKFFFFYAIAAALLVVANFGMMHTRGQSVSCLNQLAPCLNYLNGTKEVPQDLEDLLTRTEAPPLATSFLSPIG
ncbi:unnamed protein product [Eruca vesicaria subsp. sativa]|uniref:Uncharacterized protein n=1 Tax=Eruca vesicaria subsp. sativa TaxID=29727 RepID=A0ABC8JH88_ERUVS|nr:unnamed protein product [Eruca vesicaria subsp. sativa]